MMAATRGARHAAPQAESSELISILLCEGCEDNADSSTVPRSAQLATHPSGNDNKNKLERGHAVDISNNFYFGSSDLLLQRPPDTPAISSGHRAVGLDGPTGWASANTSNDRRLVQLYQHQTTESAWSSQRHHDPSSAQLCVPFTPAGLCNSADEAATAAASGPCYGAPCRPESMVASSPHPVTTTTTGTTTTTSQLLGLESTTGSATSTAAASLPVDAPGGSDAITAYGPGPRGQPVGPAAAPYLMSAGPFCRQTYNPSPACTPAVARGGSFPAGASAASRQPAGGPPGLTAVASGPGSGAWLRGVSHRPGPQLGYYDAAAPPQGMSGLHPYLDYGEAVAPMTSSSLANAPPTGLGGCTQEMSSGGGGGTAAAAAGMSVAAQQGIAQPLPHSGSMVVVVGPGAGGTGSPVRHPQLHPQPHAHPHQHPHHAHLDAGAKLEANGTANSGHGAGAGSADDRISYLSQQPMDMPWPSSSRASYKNGLTAAAGAAAAGPLDLPRTPSSSALSPSTCSSGPSLEPGARPGLPYMSYHPPPPSHVHPHHAHLYHPRVHMPKRYAWPDGYGRYDPAYAPYWPSPHYQGMPVCRAASWHNGTMPRGPPGAMAGPHAAPRASMDSVSGNNMLRMSASVARQSAPPGITSSPEKQQQQPGGPPPEGAVPAALAPTASVDMYDGRGSGGPRPAGTMYSRRAPMPFAGPIAPYPVSMRSSVPGGAARFLRSSSFDSLALPPAPIPMPVPMSARDPQQQQQQQQQGSSAMVKEETLPLEAPMMEMAPSPGHPPLLETRESSKRRRTVASWSLPGPLSSVPSAPPGLMQPIPQPPDLQPQLSLPSCHTIPDASNGSTAAATSAEAQLIPHSPFAFTPAAAHAGSGSQAAHGSNSTMCASPGPGGGPGPRQLGACLQPSGAAVGSSTSLQAVHTPFRTPS
ncbi:hypothetical protein Vretifemale_291, partial [Volvox reticuliferus]